MEKRSQLPQFVLQPHTQNELEWAEQLDCVYRSCPAKTVALLKVSLGYIWSCALFLMCAVASAWMTLICHICVEGDDVAAVYKILPGIFCWTYDSKHANRKF